MADTILGNLTPQEIMALLRMQQGQTPAPPANAQISGSQEPSLLDIFYGGKRAAEDRLAANSNNRRPYIVGDPTPLSPVTEAVADPSGVNTVNAGISAIPFMPKLPVKQMVAGGLGLLGGSLLQANRDDVNAANEGVQPKKGLFEALRQSLGNEFDPAEFRKKWEAENPLPQAPGTQEDYIKRQRETLMADPQYADRMRRAQIAESEKRKTEANNLRKQADEWLTGKLEKDTGYNTAVQDYETRKARRPEAYKSAEAAERARLEEVWRKSYDKPFMERNPAVGKTLLGASWLIPAMLGVKSTTKDVAAKSGLLNEINQARTSANLPAEAEALKTLQNYTSQSSPAWKTALKVAGIAAPAEMRAGMDFWDANAAPQNTPARTTAENNLWGGGLLDYAKHRAIDAGSGFLTYKSTQGLAHLKTPGALDARVQTQMQRLPANSANMSPQELTTHLGVPPVSATVRADLIEKMLATRPNNTIPGHYGGRTRPELEAWAEQELIRTGRLPAPQAPVVPEKASLLDAVKKYGLSVGAGAAAGGYGLYSLLK